MYTYLTPEPITLEIFNPDGKITVELSETTTTTVSVEATSSAPLGFLDDLVRSFGPRGRFGRGPWGGDDQPGGVDVLDSQTDLTELVRVEHVAAPEGSGEGGAVIVDADAARRRFRTAFTIRVTAPNGSNVRVKGHSSDVRVTGTAGLADIRSASGNIDVTETGGNTLVQTASGNVSLRAARADLDARSVSGDLRIGTAGGRAELETTSGDTTVERATGDLRSRSVSGNIVITAVSAGETDVRTVSGNVAIGVIPGVRAAIDLHSVAGRTESDFAVNDAPAPRVDLAKDDTAAAPSADGAVLMIKARSTSGNIRLRRV